MGQIKGWVIDQKLLANCGGIIEAARRDKNTSLDSADNRRCRIEQMSLIDFLESLLISTPTMPRYSANH